MAFFSEFPRSRTYDSDLGWLLHAMHEADTALKALIDSDAKNTADIKKLKDDIEYIIEALQQPITEWSASNTYKQFQLVEYQGTIYIALKDVPVGVGIGDTEYWSESGNVYAIIAAMQTAISNNSEDIIDIYDLLANTDNVLLVDNYAAGDGVTNDRDAIATAAAAAETENKTLVFGAGKTYFISGDPIPLNCSTDFNGATILMEDETTTGFIVGAAGDTITFDAAATTAFNIGNADYYNKGFYYISDTAMGNRSGGSGNYYYYAQYLMTDAEGNFINAPLETGFGTGHTGTIINPQRYDLPTLTIKNANIEYKATSAESKPFIDIYRNNVNIDGLNINSPILDTSIQGHIIRAIYCCNVNIRNVRGTNVSQDTAHSSYVILLYGVSDIYIADMDTSTGWGNTGLSFVTNITGERLNCNRLDVHYGHNGHIVFNNCTCAGNLGVASIGMGFATITFNSCEWIGSSADAWCVMFRNDFGVPARQVIFNGCKFRQRGVNSAAFQVNRPAAQAEAANFDNLIPFMDLIFNHCDSDCTYWFNTTLSNDIVTPKINIYLNDFTQMYNRRICGNSNPARQLTINGMTTTGTGVMHNQSIITTAAQLVRLLNSRINLAFGSGGIYDLFVEGCYIVASSASTITGAAVLVGNMFAAGVTDRLTASGGKESSGNVFKS